MNIAQTMDADASADPSRIGAVSLRDTRCRVAAPHLGPPVAPGGLQAAAAAPYPGTTTSIRGLQATI